MKARPYRWALIGLFALTATLFERGGAAAQPIVLRYGVDTEHNINALAQVVAEREGFFAREGIKLELVHFLGTGDRPTDRSAMMSARSMFDMTRVQTTLLIQEVLQGRHVVAIAGVVDNPAYYLVARPEIRTFADLKGKSLAVTIPSDGITLTARKMLAMHGLKDADVEIKDIGGSGPRVACLKSGQCAAASLSQPSVFEALDAGFHTLGMHIEAGALLYVVDIVDRSWAVAHSDIVSKYVRATAAAFRFIAEPGNREEVVKAAMQQTGQPESRARQMLDYYWDPSHDVLPRQGEIDMNGLQAMIALLGQYGILKSPLPAPQRFVDMRYLKEAGVP
jgi:ABC-type nitrate/sulfonate/bicarbonate transport system substrate-binding protein